MFLISAHTLGVSPDLLAPRCSLSRGCCLSQPRLGGKQLVAVELNHAGGLTVFKVEDRAQCLGGVGSQLRTFSGTGPSAVVLAALDCRSCL